MSVSALTAAMLLAAAPAISEEVPLVAPMPVAPSAIEVQAPASPVTPDPLPMEQAPISELPVSLPGQEDDSDPVDDGDHDRIVVTGEKRRATPGDPLEQINAQSYAITQSVDKAFVAPVAKTYSKVLPQPVRSGLRNFFNNLAEPVVFLNYMLQLKPGKAMETLGRFAINSTVGVAGMFDMAKRKPFNLPLRRNGFANTLGFYGVKPGAFLFLPLVGPTTVRDFIGLSLDKLLLPTVIGKPFDQPYYALPSAIIGSIDYRVEFDEQLKKQRESADPYAASRDNYLKTRQVEIDALHGRVAEPAVPAVTPLALPRPNAPPAPVIAPAVTDETTPPAPAGAPANETLSPALVPNF